MLQSEVISLSPIPGLANVQDVDTVGAELPEVRLHVHLKVLRTKVALSGKEHLNVLRGRVENRGELGRGHVGRLID
jgi:anionic cell wall polymer biosynthesis LytR-Cps2A-Psr (LCP) family protein